MQLESFIESRRIEGQLLEQLGAMSKTDKDAFSPILKILSPSANTCRRILKLASETARRDKTTIAEIMSRDDLQETLSEGSWSRKIKTEKFCSLLESYRYPDQARLRKYVAEKKKSLEVETGFEVKTPKDLEGDTIEVVIKLRSERDAEAAGLMLQKISKDNALSSLFQTLRGEYE